jgi:hypothetical protein
MIRRWFAKRFLTSVRPGLYNVHAGRVLTTDEWDAGGGWAGALRDGWTVERPNWWERHASSAVTAATVEEARARLDEWQDEQAIQSVRRGA